MSDMQVLRVKNLLSYKFIFSLPPVTCQAGIDRIYLNLDKHIYYTNIF